MKPLNWTAHLDCTERGPRSNLANAVEVLHHAPDYGPDQLYYDEFLDRVMLVRSPTRPWRDDDDTAATVYMQTTVGMTTIAESQVASAVRLVARQRTKHCVRDALVPWDGEPRIDASLLTYWGALPSEAQPDTYLRAAGRNFWLSLGARILHPGCQVDTMLVLEGPQGCGKSRSLRIIGGPYYLLCSESMASKDFLQALIGVLVAEAAELDSLTKADSERVKSVVTSPEDKFRSPYGRAVVTHPRTCVIVGTTNRSDYGRDDTGLRRFIPVACGPIDIPALARDRDQLLAEATARVTDGADWWHWPSDTADVQADRQFEDAWTPAVLTWIGLREDVSIAEVLAGALGFSHADMTIPDQRRVGTILRLAGWQKANRRRDGRQTTRWLAPLQSLADR